MRDERPGILKRLFAPRAQAPSPAGKAKRPAEPAPRETLPALFLDAETGLPIRDLLYDRIGQAIRHAERTERSRIAVLSVGLEGRDAPAIREITDRLQDSLRGGDSVARFDTESPRFLILLAGIPFEEDAALVAQKLLACLSRPFRLPAGGELCLEPSIGIAIFPADGASAASLAEAAEFARTQALATRVGYRFATEPEIVFQGFRWPAGGAVSRRFPSAFG